MVSGTALFFGLFNNLAIFIVLVAVYGALNSYSFKSSRYKRQSMIGLVFGLAAIGCMFVKIPAAEGVIVDQRNAIVALSGAFGGPLAALISGIMAGSFRVYLGGAGSVAGVVGVGLAALAGIGLFKLRHRIDSVVKAALGALAATLIILPGFLPFIDLQTGWALLKEMALPYGCAVFLGIFLVGLLLAHEENRHEAELEQKKSEKRYRELFENLIDLNYRTDREGKITVLSPSCEKIFGYPREEMLGRQMASFYRNPSRRQKLIDRINKDGYIENFESEIRRKDGSYAWISTNAKRLVDEDGSYIGIEGVTRDISQLKQSQEEKKQLEASLRQSQKMEAIGTLAGGIAHDFNNILSAIIGYSEIAQGSIPESNEANRDIREVLKAGQRAKELVNHILLFSRKSEQVRTPIKINTAVEDTLKLLRATLPATIRICQEMDSQCGTILADTMEIQQVIMNLFTNAAQEMEQEGVLSIALEGVTLSELDLINDPEREPGPYVKLTVSDTGSGIPQDKIDRIFEPYFTTKAVGKGSGLGLSIVHGIVTSHEGIIRVDSEINKGTTFSIFFPKIADVHQEMRYKDDPLPTGNERILLVDDEPSIVDSTHKRLKLLGYEVLSKTSSKEALELFRMQPDAFDLIISDHTMPELTGSQLAKALNEIRSDIRIILCTGHRAKVNVDALAPLNIKEILVKPVDQRELATTVRKVLDATR